MVIVIRLDYLIMFVVWVTICTHLWVHYSLSEKLYVQVKINGDSNDNQISGNDSILNEMPYFHPCLYAVKNPLVFM